MNGDKKLAGRERDRAMRLMEALSGVDGELLERCGQERRAAVYRIPVWRWAQAAAAVLCLVMVGAASFGGYQLMRGMNKGSFSGGADNMAAQEIELKDIEGEMTAEISAEISEDTMLEEEGESGMDYATPADVAGGAADGEENEAGKNEADASRFSGNTDELNGAVQSPAMEEGKQQTESDEVEGALKLQSQKLMETQARADAVLGSYVPGVLPEGYVFENASCMPDEAEENLSVCWVRGMDSIFLFLSKPAQLPKTVDVDRTESFDQRLYEVPYCDTVPEEYRESFDNPVFAAQDLSLEIIESRMKSYNDSGDTDTPRGNFSVLYPDGVLVRFSGRGTAAQIWEMFQSMGE